MLLYGSSKTGKTYFAGTAGSRTLYLNTGDGLETLLSPAFTRRYPESNGMIIADIREAGATTTADAFDAVCRVIDNALENLSGEFDTVVLDEASALRRFALNKAMELNTQARTSGTRKSRMDTFVKPDIGDYGLEMQMIEWFLGTYIPIFKEARKNFLMIAHERQVYGKPPKIGDEAPLIKVLPGFTGKTFPDTVPAYFDDVWRSETAGSNVYRVRTYGNDKQVGGNRHGGVFEQTESDPNYLKLLNKIRSAR